MDWDCGVGEDGSVGEPVGGVSDVRDRVGVGFNAKVASGFTEMTAIVGGIEADVGVSTGLTGGVGMSISSPPHPIKKTMKAAKSTGQ